MPIEFGSLFAGIGGFDLAFERAGMHCAWQVEIDKSCQSVLGKHFPETEKFSDVREVGRQNLTSVDLIAGGFPCQDLSIAGQRKGLVGGERSGLWFEFHRILTELRPRWAVIENVPGLLSSNKGRDFAVLLRGLVDIGYGVSWRILDAQYFGVAQRRRRVFIVGSLGDGRSAEVLFEREGSAGSLAQSEEKGKDSATATLRGFGHGWQGQHNDTNAVVVGALQERDYKGIGTTIDDKIVVDALQARDYKGVGNQYVQEKKLVAVGHSGGETLKINDKVNTINTQTGSETTAMFNGVWQMNHASEVYREGANENISPTLQERMGTGGNNVPLHGIRRLTPVECERLQGFPDNWTDGESDSSRYRQLGNAVAVPVAEWIARRIVAVEA